MERLLKFIESHKDCFSSTGRVRVLSSVVNVFYHILFHFQGWIKNFKIFYKRSVSDIGIPALDTSSSIWRVFFQILFLWKRLISPRGGGGGGGVVPEKLGGDVRPASQNPYPIYDQNLRYSLPYLWPDFKIKTQFRPMLNYHKHNLWRAFVDFLFDNDEKVASS